MGRKKGRRRAPFKLKFKKDTLYSIASVLLLSIGALIIISFSRQGSLLAKINTFIAFQFGWTALLIPFLFVAAGLMLTQLKWKITKPTVFLGSLLFFISAMALTSSGKIGEEVWLNISALISKPGAVVVLLGSAFIGFMIFTETPFDEILINLSKIIRKVSRFSKRSKKASYVAQTEIQIKGMEEESQKKKPEAKKEESKKKQASDLGTQVVTNVPDQDEKVWELPPLDILEDVLGEKADRGDLKGNAAIIEQTLDSFGVQARVVEVNTGPAVTQYALEISLGTKLSKITALQNDLALALAAPTGQIRIEAPIPGRALVGIEIPNRKPEFVGLKKMLTSEQMKKSKSVLTVGLGLDVSGTSVVANIARMPHVLIAGATGSGKSVCINSFIATMLFRASPNEIKFILIDPKRVELPIYNGIPHLLTPVIVEPEKVVSALKWTIAQMEKRYKMFAEVGARNIEGYNELSGFQALPYIVVIIDELADIILFSPSEVEDTITRLAQMARATGIHLILATQRPSVDVLTGLIKANIPCRIAFNVTSMVDSRVIIDMPGSEKLLGRGDMLYIPPEQSKPTRIQGTFVSEPEVHRLIEHLKQSGIKPQYTEEVTSKYKAKVTGGVGVRDEEVDELFDEAVRLVCEYDRASASLLQRRLSVGYARAARILDQLEHTGVVGPSEGSKPREVLIQNASTFIAQRRAASEQQE
jgi:S-DNA-T family DNA segregation ATPase FtsK/SpoIIIE